MRINVKTNTCLYLVILLFLVPMEWILAWLVAMLVHEVSHWLAVVLCGGKVLALTVGIGGMQMRAASMTDGKRLVCILSGPAGGFLLACLGLWMPKIALCSWFLSAYNLLPFRFLDGGKALQILAGCRVVGLAEKICTIVLSAIGVYLSLVLRLGPLPLVIIAGLWLKSRKSPCKPSVSKLQ